MAAFIASALPLGTLVGVGIIVAAAFLAYLPSLNGGFIWDDKELYLTQNPLIKAADGLFRFWCTAEAWDYYPISNSSLWIEWRLWEMHPMGYRLTNLILHIAEALLIWNILRKLCIPGGFLAGIIFALHPVNVESVAWISQRKDMLAVLFFLLSILWYLKVQKASGNGHRETESDFIHPSSFILHPLSLNAWYWLSLAGFVSAMLGKGSAVVLPVFLLGIIWRLRRVTRHDLMRIGPFFGVAVMLSAVNVWFQRHGSGEVIRSADFTERLLGAGGVVWFYLYKAVLPINLLFIYPQWRIEAGNLAWWLPLAAFVFVTIFLWLYRKSWGRGIFVAWVFFCAALVPAMGFTDIFFMRYSLAADHYQHIAIIPVIALLAAGFGLWHSRLRGAAHRAATELAVVAAVILAVLTFLQSSQYSDEITLYTATLRKNPSSWMLHNNLGNLLWQEGRVDEALAEFEESLKLNPNYPQVHDSLGAALLHTDRRQEGIEHIREALKLKPTDSEAHYLLGNVALEEGRLEEAIDYYRQALSARPDFPDALNNLGLALVRAGRPGEAIESYQAALKIDPGLFAIESNLGNAYVKAGELVPAIEHFERAMKLARAQGENNLAERIEKLLNMYRGELPQMKKPDKGDNEEKKVR